MDAPLDQRFREALQLHSHRRHAEAERIYREILAADPTHVSAMHFIGVLAHQCGHSMQAEPIIRRSLELRPTSGPFHNNYGDVLRALGRHREAIAAFVRSAELDSTNFMPPLNVGLTLASLQRGPEAVPWLRKALALRPDHVEAMFMLAQALLMTPDKGGDEALQLLDRCIALDPANERARFVRAAVRGEAPPAVPPGFVRGIFDGYAENFDRHLVQGLKYRAPQLLREAVVRAIAGDTSRRFDILDLGCGTGLVGEAFKDLAASLAGVDLSPGMLIKARDKAIYDTLDAGDCVASMHSRAGKLELILAGDVLIYIGDLADLFASAATALRSGGLFAFTVETHDGEGFVLNPARRFEHSHAYLAHLAARSNFEIVSNDEVILRQEAEQGVNSRIYVMRKR